MPSDKHIAKFQELYLNRFKKEIGVEEAREKLAALVHFLKIVLKPMDGRNCTSWNDGTTLPNKKKL